MNSSASPWRINESIRFIPSGENEENSRYIVEGLSKPLLIAGWAYLAIQLLVVGETPDSIAISVNKQYERDLSPGQIERTFKYFENYGVIVGEQTNRDKLQVESENDYIWHNLVSFTFNKQLISEALANKLAEAFSILYRKKIYTVLLTASIILISLAVIKALSYKLLIDPYVTIPLFAAAMPLIVLYNILVAFFHECGHLGAANSTGCSPGEVGIGIYLFTPAMYTRINQAYFLPLRDRIFINGGGIYINIVILGVLSAISIITSSLIIMLIIINDLASLLSNLNPIYKYDGYWIVSDWLEIPNLHRRMEETIRQTIKNRSIPSTREGHLLAIYLVTTCIYLIVATAILIKLGPAYIKAYPQMMTNYWRAMIIALNSFNIKGILWNLYLLTIMCIPVIGFSILTYKVSKWLARPGTKIEKERVRI